MPLALPVHWGVVWNFVDERHSPEQESAIQECMTASIPICHCYASLIMNGFTHMCEIQLKAALAKQHWQSQWHTITDRPDIDPASATAPNDHWQPDHEWLRSTGVRFS